MSLRALVIAVLTAGALAGAASPSHAAAPRNDSLGAGWREQQEEARRAVREGRHIPLARILDQIRRMNPGRQLDAGIEAGPGGRAVYRVRWAADNGQRLDYIVDAESGQILQVEGR
jgi:uncharacterized membrane protein YkoI